MAFCKNCGKEIADDALMCPNCGSPANEPVKTKSKVAAVLLALFLGGIGLHNFYMNYVGRGIAQILINLIGFWFFGIGPIIVGLWCLIEIILILCGKLKPADGEWA